MLLHRTPTRLIELASRLAMGVAFVITLAGISSTPAAAQQCSDCKIPSGYTTVPQTGESCVNKRVACNCNGIKSDQPICLYKAKAGGVPHEPVITPNPK